MGPVFLDPPRDVPCGVEKAKGTLPDHPPPAKQQVGAADPHCAVYRQPVPGGSMPDYTAAAVTARLQQRNLVSFAPEGAPHARSLAVPDNVRTATGPMEPVTNKISSTTMVDQGTDPVTPQEFAGQGPARISAASCLQHAPGDQHRVSACVHACAASVSSMSLVRDTSKPDLGSVHVPSFSAAPCSSVVPPSGVKQSPPVVTSMSTHDNRGVGCFTKDHGTVQASRPPAAAANPYATPPWLLPLQSGQLLHKAVPLCLQHVANAPSRVQHTDAPCVSVTEQPQVVGVPPGPRTLFDNG